MILVITNGDVTITRNFSVGLGDRSGDFVGVQVAASGVMDQAQNISISNISSGRELVLLIEVEMSSVGEKDPVVVRILVVVTCDLLLGRAFGICLDVRME